MSELNWIRNVDKSLPTPKVIFQPIWTDGFYCGPDGLEYYDADGKPYHNRYGVIYIHSNVEDWYVPSILAHEWRHHWQTYHGWKYDGANWGDVHPNDMTWEEYHNRLKRYFYGSKSEMDCLRFQYKHTSKLYDNWLDIFYNTLTQ